MAERMTAIPRSRSLRAILAVLVILTTILACSSGQESNPTTLTTIASSITLMEGNDCTQSIVVQVATTWGQVVEAGTASGFVNDEARSALLDGVPAGTLIRVFDSRDGDMSDDWAEILVTALASGRCVATFEDDFSDDAITVVYHAVNGLDGKVSRVEILSASASSAGASTASTATQSTPQAIAPRLPDQIIPTTQPLLEPPSLTPSAAASVTPERRSDLIVFTPEIIGSHIDEVEETLGPPVEIYDLGIGEVEEVPDGGQERGYQVGLYTLYVTFDKDGIAHGLQVADGLLADGYSLDDWPVVLARIGVDFVGLPDVVAPAARRWTDAFGYAIMVAADSMGGTVWTVRIYELPQ